MTGTTPRPLFRLEAMQARRGQMWSGAAMRAPVALSMMTASLVVAVLAIGVFLGTQSYARKAATTGYLAPSQGLVLVMPPRAGLIVSVAVADGDLVHAGDTLLQVTAGRTSATGADVDASVRGALIQHAGCAGAGDQILANPAPRGPHHPPAGGSAIVT